MGQERSQHLGGEALGIQQAGGAIPFKALVGVVVVLSEGEGDDLGDEVGDKLFLACRVCNSDVILPLALAETDEL